MLSYTYFHTQLFKYFAKLELWAAELVQKRWRVKASFYILPRFSASVPWLGKQTRGAEILLFIHQTPVGLQLATKITMHNVIRFEVFMNRVCNSISGKTAIVTLSGHNCLLPLHGVLEEGEVYSHVRNNVAEVFRKPHCFMCNRQVTSCTKSITCWE